MQVPLLVGQRAVKNLEARFRKPASVVKPTKIEHVQQCIRWAIQHGVSLTVIGGGHSGHCQWPNVVAIDMSAFDQLHIVPTEDAQAGSSRGSATVVVAGAGCTTGEIVRQTTAAGVTIPMGARPSVGAGLWLQGGIGHTSRIYGLTCDSIVGVVLVSVQSGQLLCLGNVPSHLRPAGVASSENESDLLWAIKGAATNFGIVISVTFRTYMDPVRYTRDWAVPANDRHEARLRLGAVNHLARDLPHRVSVDAYLYTEADQLRLGVTMFESVVGGAPSRAPVPAAFDAFVAAWGPGNARQTMSTVDLFEAEMYMSTMHGGHGAGKTCSFKRCVFLESIEGTVAETLVAAVETRPGPLCYLHLLHGGGAIRDVAADATAFGCRDWEFACVITGVWPRGEDQSEVARAAVAWVYKTTDELLPRSGGVYGADLGPDPPDQTLAARAFAENGLRLHGLKRTWDPHRILAYACPLRKPATPPELIVLVTGESCAGKDYCADIWASLFNSRSQPPLTARMMSISDTTKQEYASATGADQDRLLWDRGYKEQHRPALEQFFRSQVQRQPRLPEEHFLAVVQHATDVHVLFITGMRDEAPVSAFSHLVPGCRLLDVRVRAPEQTRRKRRSRCDCRTDHNEAYAGEREGESMTATTGYCPSLIFTNDATGRAAVERFAEQHLLPFMDQRLQRLARMARPASNFPRSGIDFRHVLDISQQPHGLALCTSLMQEHFFGHWHRIRVIVCCEVGGFIFASALAVRLDIPLVLIREAGKLPPPTISVLKSASHISSSTSGPLGASRMEMDPTSIPRNASVLVVDDALATGRTLCAVLQLLEKAHASMNDVHVMVVAEFPVHRGRELLRQHGYGHVRIQSLLVFDGA